MFKTNKSKLVLAIALASSFNVHADIRINGFANFTAGATTNDDEMLSSYNGDVNYDNDSLFALQVSGDINNRMTATGQVIARGIDDYDASLEWAYVTYQGDNDLSYTAGRFRMPLFAYSASLDVGYSYHWLSAPAAVYKVPYRNMDGIKVEKVFSDYGLDYKLGLSHGRVSGETLGAELDIQNTTIASFEVTNMTWTGRLVYGTGDLTIDTNGEDPTLQLLQNFGVGANAYGFAQLSENILLEEDRGSFVGGSLFYDNSEFFAGAEYTQTEVDDSFASQDVAYYATAGYRAGKWTAALTYEVFESEGDVDYQDDIDALALIDAQSFALAQVATGLQASQLEEYETITATVRYEAATRTAVTLESNFYDNELLDETATLVRLGLSYVF